METIQNVMKKDRYASHTGIELLSVSPGHAIARMQVQPLHLNGVGSVQGGALFTLADFAFAAAVNAHGKVAVAINVSITFMKAVSTGLLLAEAREVALNSRLGTYQVQITDESNALVATFQGLAYRKNEPIGSGEHRG